MTAVLTIVRTAVGRSEYHLGILRIQHASHTFTTYALHTTPHTPLTTPITPHSTTHHTIHNTSLTIPPLTTRHTAHPPYHTPHTTTCTNHTTHDTTYHNLHHSPQLTPHPWYVAMSLSWRSCLCMSGD